MSINGKQLEIYESSSASDICSIDDKRPKLEVVGDVIIEDNFGNEVFGRNKFIINGSLLALRKLFNVDSKYSFKTINQIMNINPTFPIPANPEGVIGPNFKDAVYLFSVGVGGSGDAFESVKTVKYNEVDVSGIIPFKYTKLPLTPAEKKQYFLIKKDAEYTGYYAKRFDSDPVIKSVNKDGTEVPNNVESLTSDDIDTFIELRLTINKRDCREWFEVKGAGVESARINTLSLLAGIPVEVSPGVTDYVNLKAITKYNFKNEALEHEKELYITYRIYI